MPEPRRASDLLPDILARVKTSAGRGKLTEALASVLGDELMKYCHVRSFRAGKLVVEIDSAPLFAELSGFRSEEIRSALNERLAKQKIARLQLRMGGTGHV